MKEKKCRHCAMMIPSEAKICPHCRKKQGLPLVVKLILILVGLYVIGKITVPSYDDMRERAKQGATQVNSASSSGPKYDKQWAIDQIKIKKLDWYKSGFDSVMMVNVTFKNDGYYDVKDIELTCDDYSHSGTKIDSNSRVVYEIVREDQTKRIRNFNMGFINSQVATTNCRITDLTVIK